MIFNSIKPLLYRIYHVFIKYNNRSKTIKHGIMLIIGRVL